MNEERIRDWIARYSEESFSRSSGPGGQNVNKVNTKATLRVDLALLEGVSASERIRLLEKLSSRLTGGSTRTDTARQNSPDTQFPPEGGLPQTSTGTELVIQVQDERSQLQNRELAVERAVQIIIKALHREKPRKATKPSRASQERRVASKKVAASHKKNRGRPGVE